MDVHDWFYDNKVSDQLKELAKKIDADESGGGFDIFIEGLKQIVGTSIRSSSATPYIIRALIELEDGEGGSVNDMVSQAFNMITCNLNNEYELETLQYREGMHTVNVDYRFKGPSDA